MLAWADGRLSAVRWWPSLLLVLVALPATVLLLLEVRLRLVRREELQACAQRRFLHVTDAGVSFTPSGRPVIGRSRVLAFWFEDVPGEARYGRLMVEYLHRPSYGRLPGLRPYVLEKSLEEPHLISKLTYLRQHARFPFWIHLNQRVPVCELPPQFMRGLFLQAGGLLLLLHGVPLLAAWLYSGHAAGRPGPAWPTPLPPKLGEFLAAHFANSAAWLNFMLTTGLTLTVAGAALIIYGAVISRARIIRLVPAGAPGGTPPAGQTVASF